MSKSNNSNGIFTISLDLELYWGMRDHVAIDNYAKNLEGVENVIETLLQLFDQQSIHATWAPVGFLFFEDLTSLKQNLPNITPSYDNTDLNPYTYIENTQLEKYHFIPNIINKISTFKNQEIGTHTFSHFYCLEDGQTLNQFRADLVSAVAITKKKLNREIKSLIFPRNQWNSEYLSILTQLNISCFRGTEDHWIYRASKEHHNTLLKRALRLLDTYINLTGHHTYSLEESMNTKPYNIPASRFLRPVSQPLSLFENIRLNRILAAMNYAAKTNQVFHLWWHPHNFGSNIELNIRFLKKILNHYTYLHTHYNMQSLCMGEIASLLETGITS